MPSWRVLRVWRPESSTPSWTRVRATAARMPVRTTSVPRRRAARAAATSVSATCASTFETPVMSMMATGARVRSRPRSSASSIRRALLVDVADERHQHHARVERDEGRRELGEQLVLHADDLLAQAGVLGLGALPLD